MLMTAGIRKLALTAHVGSSVGWLGAVAAFLVLSIAGLASADAEMVRAAYLAMNLIGEFMIVPLSLAALLTGLVQSLGTHWGLFKHYWVLTKFALTLVATTLLLLHQFTAVAGAAQRVSVTPARILPQVGGLGTQLVVDAALGLLVLIVTMTLSVYKPWGRTAYGRRVAEQTAAVPPVIDRVLEPMAIGLKVFIGIIGAILATIVVIHLAGGGLSHR
jgi:hypothetical protein